MNTAGGAAPAEGGPEAPEADGAVGADGTAGAAGEGAGVGGLGEGALEEVPEDIERKGF